MTTTRRKANRKRPTTYQVVVAGTVVYATDDIRAADMTAHTYRRNGWTSIEIRRKGVTR